MSKQRIVNIYTDGSCRNNAGGGGWASVIFLSKDYEVLEGWETVTTNNRMELMAIYIIVNLLSFSLSVPTLLT